MRVSLVAALLLGWCVSASATIVRFDTNLGSFYVDLLENEAPNTVANFLSYLHDGDYEGSLVHRSVPGFVIQGGRFTFDGSQFVLVEKDDPIANEFGQSNLRGTMAMAKVSGDANSATSEWFVNMDDNSATLDSDNGGFTVFGRVLGNGMEVVDLINSIGRFNLDGASLSEIPLVFSGAAAAVGDDNVIRISVVEVSGFEINQGLSGAWFNPATPGQGWTLDVFVEGDRREVFAAWFTYDINAPSGDDGAGFGSTQHRWFTASGAFDGDTATLTLFRNSGGTFNTDDPNTLESVGTLSIRFTDCMNAILTFDFDDASVADDSFPIVRLTPDAFCQSIGLPGVSTR